MTQLFECCRDSSLYVQHMRAVLIISIDTHKLIAIKTFQTNDSALRKKLRINWNSFSLAIKTRSLNFFHQISPPNFRWRLIEAVICHGSTSKLTVLWFWSIMNQNQVEWDLTTTSSLKTSLASAQCWITLSSTQLELVKRKRSTDMWKCLKIISAKWHLFDSVDFMRKCMRQLRKLFPSKFVQLHK